MNVIKNRIYTHQILEIIWVVFMLSAYISCSLADTHYVSKTGGNSSPYTSWSTAALHLQSAINVASSNDTVLVNDGSYICPSNIYVNTKGLTIKSLNGSEKTIVDGNNACRCFYLYNYNSAAVPNIVVDGFTITRGGNVSDGAGVYMYGNSTVRNCVIINNACGDGGTGGAINLYTSGCLVENCIIVSNSCGNGTGGGVKIASSGMSPPNILRNCLVAHNIASTFGGGVSASGGFIQNCTITENHANTRAGGIWNQLGVVNIQNSIIYNNTDDYASSPNDNYGFYNLTTLTNCCLTPSFTGLGSGNITADPLFIDNALNNYRLDFGSACINAGINQSWMSVSTDLDGNNRIINSTVDIGCYERNAPTTPTGLSASDGTYTNKVYIQWNTSANATGYEIYRAFSELETKMNIGHVSVLNYDDTLAVPNSNYYYWVKATNVYYSSDFSSYNTGWKSLYSQLMDADLDGLCDYDEFYIYHTNPFNEDTDFDGTSDGNEIIAGTSPTNSSDYFTINDVSFTQNNNIILHWNSISGREYSILSKTNFSVLGWTTNAFGIVGDGSLKAYTNSENNTYQFFRLGVTKP